MPLVVGVRCSFRSKDAGSAVSRSYRCDLGRRIGASSGADGTARISSNPLSR
jgi:hypothetical protein